MSAPTAGSGPVDLPAWSTLVAAALVGTERQPDPVPGLPGEATTALLAAAAARWTSVRAGVATLRVTGTVEPAPAETLPTIGGAAWNRLAALLDSDRAANLSGDRAELLRECLQTIADAGRLVPGELLPALLDQARRHPELRTCALAAGGTRAGWLAAQRTEWAHLTTVVDTTAGDDPEAWEFGTVGRRAGFLAALRARDPGAARELFAAAWPDEAPADRATLLGTFDTGLSPADENLLEQALDDRRKEVRAVAADLLARLPDSAYAGRMTARARACVSIHDPSPDSGPELPRDLRPDASQGSHTLAVHPPMSCDKAMRRDGVAAKPPAGLGERAWWLMELLARTPLASWTVDGPDGPALASTPGELLALPVADDWAGPLRRGLARAAVAQANRAWAGPLVRALLPVDGPRRRSEDLPVLLALFELLPPDEQVPIAVQALADSGNQPYDAHPFLVHCPTPWPAPLADAFFVALERLLARRAADWSVTQLCQLAAVRLAPGQSTRAEALAATVRAKYPGGADERVLNSLTDTLRFRHDMLKELA